MTLIEFFREYSLHDSSAAKIEFSSHNRTLTLSLELCNFMQKTYRENDPEIVEGTLTFFNVEHLAIEPDSSIFDLKEGADAGIIQAKLIHPKDANSPEVQMVLELADHKTRSNGVFVMEFKSSNVEWTPTSAQS